MQIIGESLGAIGAALTRSQASSMLLVCIALLMSTAFVGLVVPVSCPAVCEVGLALVLVLGAQADMEAVRTRHTTCLTKKTLSPITSV